MVSVANMRDYTASTQHNREAQLELQRALLCNFVFLKRDISGNEDVISDGN